MSSRRSIVALLVVLLAAGFVSADIKVVKMTHRDGFSIMGQDQPAADQEEVTWIGADRLRSNQGDTSAIVRLDTKKLIIINHADQTFNAIDLPLDISKFLPPQMADQMLAMMTLDVTVTPTDERQKIGDWQARRYDMKMTSQMMTIDATLWATTAIDLDQETYRRMVAEILRLQPGAANMAEEMAKIEGLVVAQESMMSMTMVGDTKVSSSEKVTSVEEKDPPPGNYDPPEGYTEKPFDFMKMMQQQQ